jgi:hypothetical protein
MLAEGGFPGKRRLKALQKRTFAAG